MPQALIKINGTAGSNDNLPIATLVQLANANVGGESSYAWVIVSQPAGTADVLSSTSITNPTFTPNKEGTYLIQLTVNGTLVNSVVAAIQQLKTGIRVPAATETTQDNSTTGWYGAVTEIFQLLDSMNADPLITVGQSGSSTPVRGSVVYASATAVIKSGLPGQETVVVWDKCLATGNTHMYAALGVVEQAVGGGSSPSSGVLIQVRRGGRFAGVTDGGSVGDSIYVSNTGTLSSTPGTYRRKVGIIIAASGGSVDVEFDGAILDIAAGVTVGSIANGSYSATMLASGCLAVDTTTDAGADSVCAGAYYVDNSGTAQLLSAMGGSVLEIGDPSFTGGTTYNGKPLTVASATSLNLTSSSSSNINIATANALVIKLVSTAKWEWAGSNFALQEIGTASATTYTAAGIALAYHGGNETVAQEDSGGTWRTWYAITSSAISLGDSAHFTTTVQSAGQLTLTAASGDAVGTASTGVFGMPFTDSTATPGAATINKGQGRTSIANGASAVVITNSIPTSATSHGVIITMETGTDSLVVKLGFVLANASLTVTAYNATGGVQTTSAALIFRWQLTQAL